MSTNATLRRLLDEAGTTYADEAGITLADKPMPLFELLVLCMLASKPIDASIATRAA
ncbi:endonuclease, partial [Mycobacterium sp. ITM-2017-0098]